MMWRHAAMNRRSVSLALILLLASAESAAAGGHGEKAEKKKGGGGSFLQLGAITATVIRADGKRGALTVETGIDAPSPALQAKAALLIPRFKAAYVQVLQTYAAGLAPAAAPNAEFLSREFQRQTDMVLGAKGARLLLGTILLN